MYTQPRTIAEINDPVHTVQLFHDILENTNYVYSKEGYRATFDICLDEKLDVNVYRNLSNDGTFKDFLPLTYKKHIEALESQHRCEVEDLKSQIYMLRESIEITTKAMALSQDIKDFNDLVGTAKKRGWKFWN